MSATHFFLFFSLSGTVSDRVKSLARAGETTDQRLAPAFTVAANPPPAVPWHDAPSYTYDVSS